VTVPDKDDFGHLQSDFAFIGGSLSTAAWQEEYEREQRQQREAVIAKFDAGESDATLQAMDAEILLPGRRAYQLPLPTDIVVLAG
jgi:hypothetical protein